VNARTGSAPYITARTAAGSVISARLGAAPFIVARSGPATTTTLLDLYSATYDDPYGVYA
jgi:hypothetical protein